MDTDTPPIGKKEKPTWLQILEAESWQAEMLISGAAIYGSLQLPTLISRLIDKALLWLPDDILEISYFIFWYLILGSSTLIVCFILHFVIRALWIGMIGLVSVFPEGIKKDADFHSAHFMGQLLEEFPDVNLFNQKLDNFCSAILGAAFGVVILMGSISLTLIGFLIIAFILSQLLPLSTFTLFSVLLSFIFIPAFLTIIANSKKFRENRWVKQYHFKFAVKIYGRIVYNIFYEPAYYILYIFTTNFKKDRLGLSFFVFTLLIMGISIPVLLSTNAFVLKKDLFFRMAETDDRLYPQHYEDQLVSGSAILAPMIPSDLMSGEVLKVFIPMTRREKVLVNTYCAAYQNDESLSRMENNRRRKKHITKCRSDYYEFFVNDIPYDELAFFRYTHPNAGEEGLITFIPTENFLKGINTLRIVHLYTDEAGQKKESLVPFWFAPNEGSSD
ncbi:MAG: hypothetical protein R2828_26590 [Saprospiraceae bacterium]